MRAQASGPVPCRVGALRPVGLDAPTAPRPVGIHTHTASHVGGTCCPPSGLHLRAIVLNHSQGVGPAILGHNILLSVFDDGAIHVAGCV